MPTAAALFVVSISLAPVQAHLDHQNWVGGQWTAVGSAQLLGSLATCELTLARDNVPSPARTVMLFDWTRATNPLCPDGVTPVEVTGSGQFYGHTCNTYGNHQLSSVSGAPAAVTLNVYVSIDDCLDRELVTPSGTFAQGALVWSFATSCGPTAVSGCISTMA